MLDAKAKGGSWTEPRGAKSDPPSGPLSSDLVDAE